MAEQEHVPAGTRKHWHPAMETAKQFEDDKQGDGSSVDTPLPPPSLFTFDTPAPAPAQPQPQPQPQVLQQQNDINWQQRYEELASQQQRQQQQFQSQQDELAELRNLKRKLDMEKEYTFSDINMETVDNDVAEEIGSKLLRPALERQQRMFDEKLSTVQQQLMRERAELEQLRASSQLGETNARILAAHPDFESVRQSKEFNEYMNSSIMGSSRTIGQLIAEEYHAGNADFVNNIVTQFKGGRPDLSRIASAPTSTGGRVPVSLQSEPKYTDEDVTNWNQMFITGRMSRNEFQQKMDAFRKAQS